MYIKIGFAFLMLTKNRIENVYNSHVKCFNLGHVDITKKRLI